MTYKILTPLLLLTCLQQAGCVVFPTTRTFYEPNSKDGELHNRSSCGYMSTHDSIERTVEGVRITLYLGSVEEPEDRKPNLHLTTYISSASDAVVVNPSLIRIEIPNVNSSLEGSTIESNLHLLHQTQSFSIFYPDPSGYADSVTVIFAPEAISLNGHSLTLAPFHFIRVKKHDAYYGSINC